MQQALAELRQAEATWNAEQQIKVAIE